MKIKIFNLKMKKGFLRIAASLLASASLMVSVSIPGQAMKDRIWSKFSNTLPQNSLLTKKSPGTQSSPLEDLQRNCQTEITTEINKCLQTDFGQADSMEIEGYKFTKQRYQHIAYGDYAQGVNSQGLHMKCGLDGLNKSFDIFKKQVQQLEQNQNLSDEEKNKVKKFEEELEKTHPYEIDKNNDGSSLILCKLNYSNVSHTNRYLFPENWGFKELTKALKMAIKDKADVKGILEKESQDITKKKENIQKQLDASINEGKGYKKAKSANPQAISDGDESKNLLEQCVLNDMLYGCEKKLMALNDTGLPNLYGYANTNGKSISLHIIDIGEVKNGTKSGQEILVQLVTDELTKEIVTFFPLNVQNLPKDECRIVPNEGEDETDDSNNPTNTNSTDPKDKVYDIFQRDNLHGKQFLKRTKFEISDKYKDKTGKLIYDQNVKVINNILNRVGKSVKSEESKKYLSDFHTFFNSINTGKSQNSNGKLDNYIKNSPNDLGPDKKVDLLYQPSVNISTKDEKNSQKTTLIEKLKNEFQRLTSTTPSDGEKVLNQTKILMLKTILGNAKCIQAKIKSADNRIQTDITTFDKNKSKRSEINSLRKNKATLVELMQKNGTDALLSKPQECNKFKFAQDGLNMSEKVGDESLIDKYVEELNQLLENLLMDDDVYNNALKLIKEKITREENIKKAQMAKKTKKATVKP